MDPRSGGLVPDALALLELGSIARGYRVLDALVKESPVRVIEANLIEPGRFLILTGGAVADVEAAHRVGLEVAAEEMLDHLLLPFAHRSVWAGLGGASVGASEAVEIDTVGIVEGSSIAGVLEACDRSLKEADVELGGLRVAVGLGGKGFFVVHGRQDAVETAVGVAAALLGARGKRVREEVVGRPHPEFLVWLLRPAPFSVGLR
ncbi:MAG: BMC domain-containing protein [Myxococcales bacterium]|nr:BMC domain-containing protein [Myxococcales bacterium]